LLVVLAEVLLQVVVMVVLVVAEQVVIEHPQELQVLTRQQNPH
jgi:hypothetical protein